MIREENMSTNNSFEPLNQLLQEIIITRAINYIN